MITGERYADQARRWIQRARPEAPARLPGDRRRLVGAVEGALRTRRRKRTIVRSVSTLAAAAALIVLVTHIDVHGLRWHQATVADGTAIPVAPPAAVAPVLDPRALTVVGAREGGRGGIVQGPEVVRPVRRGMMLQAGIALVAPESGDVQIGTAQGTLLTLEPGGTLTVTESNETQRFALLRGAVRARVAKLGPGERFLINSADAEIEVHGTQFRVALVEADPSCGSSSMTRVSVTEGVVSVRSAGQEVRLFPGQQWPAGCASTPAGAPQETRRPNPARVASRSRSVAQASHVVPAPAEAPVVEAAPPVAAPAPPVVALPPPATSRAPAAETPRPPVSAQVAVPASQLAAQNDLFAAAMRAKRAGRETDAIRLLTRLVRRYPDGPLAESALAQRMKLLAAGDSLAGADAAKEYISLYPDGFARADADRLAAHAAANKP